VHFMYYIECYRTLM